MAAVTEGGDEHWINPGTGDKVEWHPAMPGKPGEMGKDHWHWLPGGEKEKPHYSPGDRIKAFWGEHKRAIVVTGAVIVVVGAVALAPVTGGASLVGLAAVP
jgi:hypothetical protein